MDNTQIFTVPEKVEEPALVIPAKKFLAKRNKKHTWLFSVAKLFVVIGLVFLLLPIASTKIAEVTSASSTQSLYDMSLSLKDATKKEAGAKLPSFDSSLPTEPWIKIKSIGVDTQIKQLPIDRSEDALKVGAWMPINFGTPNSDGPVIVAAHRFGYLKWTNLFRRQHSFFNFPKLKEGDQVDIIWHQRDYKYKIYKIESNTEISNYNSDLILFTCNDLVSNMRIVVYAHRI